MSSLSFPITAQVNTHRTLLPVQGPQAILERATEAPDTALSCVGESAPEDIHLGERPGTPTHSIATKGISRGRRGITSSLLLLLTYQMVINYTSMKGLHSVRA